jgi:hypothetical protein
MVSEVKGGRAYDALPVWIATRGMAAICAFAIVPWRFSARNLRKLSLESGITAFHGVHR